MRNALILFLAAAAVVVLGILVYSQNAALKDHQLQISDLNAKLEAESKTGNLELQEKCAKQAGEDYKETGWDKTKTPFTGYENHYNEKLNKCFVVMSTSDTVSAGQFTTSKYLWDAFEGKNLGTFFWKSGKENADAPPFECDVQLPTGEKRVCHSFDEFDELVKVYMQ